MLSYRCETEEATAQRHASQKQAQTAKCLANPLYLPTLPRQCVPDTTVTRYMRFEAKLLGFSPPACEDKVPYKNSCFTRRKKDVEGKMCIVCTHPRALPPSWVSQHYV